MIDVVDDPELEELRRRKLQQLEQQAESEAAQDAQREQVEAQKQAILRQALEPEARERLTRIRMARPEMAESLETQIIQLAASGRLQGTITDEQLKGILARSQESRRDINIERR